MDSSGQEFLRWGILSGRGIISDTRELGAFGNDGEGIGTSAAAYDSKGQVCIEIY